MTAVILGFDPSPNRLGWSAIDTATGDHVAGGCESLVRSGGGWHDEQIAGAISNVWWHLRHAQVTRVAYVCREEPITRIVSMSKRYGETSALVDEAAREMWPEANHMAPFIPTEWRAINDLPAGKDGKAAAARDAAAAAGHAVTQDEADAYMVACALWWGWDVQPAEAVTA